jgi:hypothetical protein
VRAPTGKYVFPHVLLKTTEKLQYHAIAAVAIPNHPPTCVVVGFFAKAPIVRRIKVISSVTKRKNKLSDTLYEANIMYNVKMVQASRNRPVASWEVSDGSLGTTNCTYAAKLAQNAP